MILQSLPNRRFWEQIVLLMVVVLLSASWLAPNHETPWLSFHLEALAALAGLVVACYVVVFYRGTSNSAPPASVWLLTIAIIPIAQWCAGLVTYRGDAILASTYLATMGVMVWVGFSTHEKRDNVCIYIATAMLWSAILSTGIVIYQIFRLHDLGVFILDPDSNGRLSGNLGQPNHLATLLAFGLASVAWLNGLRRLTNGAAVFVAMFLLVGLAATGSRHPFLGAFLLGAWAIRAKSLHQIGVTRWLTVGALVIWLGVAYVAVRGLTASFNPAPLVEAHRLAVGLRPLLWDQFTSAIANAPWFGYGWQGGLTGQASIAIGKPGLEFSQYAHNIFIDLIVWNGIPVGVLLTTAILVWYWSIGKQVRIKGSWFQFSIVTIVLAHSAVEYPFAYTYFVVPVALAIGQLEAAGSRPGLRFPGSLPLIVIVSMVGAFIVIVDDYLELAKERRELITWKIRLGGDHPIPTKPKTLILDQLAASVEWMRVEPTVAMATNEIEKQIALSRRFPTVALLSRTVMVLGMNGQTDLAYTELLRLRGLHGEKFYRMAVEQIRGLAATSQPSLRRFVEVVDERAADMPALALLFNQVGAGRD